MELTKQNFDLIQSYISECDKRYFDDYMHKYMQDSEGNLGELENELFYFVTDLASYGGFPKVLKNDDFIKLDRPLLYHGYDKHIHAASYLWDFRFHYGRGDFGQGTYFTSDYDDAKSFTGGYKWDSSLVMSAKILPSRVIKYSMLKKIADPNNSDIGELDDSIVERLNKLYELIQSIEDERTKKLIYNGIFKVKNDYSTLAILLGFDMIENDLRPDFYEGDHYILLNRNKLVVNEKEAKVLFKKAKGDYKDIKIVPSTLEELEMGENSNA